MTVTAFEPPGQIKVGYTAYNTWFNFFLSLRPTKRSFFKLHSKMAPTKRQQADVIPETPFEQTKKTATRIKKTSARKGVKPQKAAPKNDIPTTLIEEADPKNFFTGAAAPIVKLADGKEVVIRERLPNATVAGESALGRKQCMRPCYPTRVPPCLPCDLLTDHDSCNPPSCHDPHSQ